jgi:hypothetical protein
MLFGNKFLMDTEIEWMDHGIAGAPYGTGGLDDAARQRRRRVCREGQLVQPWLTFPTLESPVIVLLYTV